jgi:hypothetical protein
LREAAVENAAADWFPEALAALAERRELRRRSDGSWLLLGDAPASRVVERRVAVG